MGKFEFAKIETRKVKVTIEREMQCVSNDSVYTVDVYKSDDGQCHKLLWDIECDTFAIGLNASDPFDDGSSYYDLLPFATINVMPDKRTAMQAWLNLTRED